jgi:hypothetical protein
MSDRVLAEILATARRIVDGEEAPYRGAAHIWRLVAEEDYRGFEDFRAWAGLAGEWEEHPEHRDDLDRDIRDEARLLLERRGESDDKRHRERS